MKALKMYVDRYGLLFVPIANGIESIVGKYMSYTNGGNDLFEGPYISGNYLSTKYDFVWFTVWVECIEDNLEDFKHIELTITFLEDVLSVKYQAYGSSIIEEVQMVPRMTEEYLVVFENDKIPYVVNFQLDYPLSDLTVDEQLEMTME